MIGLLLAAITAVNFGRSATALNYSTGDMAYNDISIAKIAGNTTFVQWHNNLVPLNTDSASLDLFEKFGLKTDEALRSSDVFIQQENVLCEYSHSNFEKTEQKATASNVGDGKRDENVHEEGFIKFTTIAYAIGFFDDHLVYHVEVKTEEQKKFSVNKKDNLIIRHGNNSITFTNNGYPTEGTRHTPCTLYFNGKEDEPVARDLHDVLTPNYSCADAGVYYTFDINGIPGATGYVTSVVGKTTVTGDYYIVATDTTEVQPVYVHNYKPFVDSLSVSFKGIGCAIDLGGGVDVMEGRPMVLNGLARRIKRQTHRINSADWGFEPRYYFKNEGVKNSTLILDDFVVDTERLRCGYIEEQYVNLSPNRYDAGDAYLELRWNKPVYEFGVYLSYWSPSDQLFSTKDDYAYLQYLDGNGEWTKWIDILERGLSTDRMKQDYFERDFIEGICGIKFVTHKETPNTNRNKGRISIGQMKITTLEID